MLEISVTCVVAAPSARTRGSPEHAPQKRKLAAPRTLSCAILQHSRFQSLNVPLPKGGAEGVAVPIQADGTSHAAARAVQRSIHDAHGEDCTDAAKGDAMPTI